MVSRVAQGRRESSVAHTLSRNLICWNEETIVVKMLRIGAVRRRDAIVEYDG